jgi:uncharacterized protein
MTTILLGVVLVALVMLAMSVGVILNGKCLRGSCGGPNMVDADGNSLLCATCPNRDEESTT